MIFQIDNTDLKNELLKLVPNKSDFNKLMNIVGEAYIAFTANVFETSGAFFGGWKPVTEGTQKAKTAAGYGNKTLIRTGELRRSTAFDIIGNTIEIFNSAVSDTGFPYGAVHQDPITSPLPKRQIYETDEISDEIIQDIIDSLSSVYR